MIRHRVSFATISSSLAAVLLSPVLCVAQPASKPVERVVLPAYVPGQSPVVHVFSGMESRTSKPATIPAIKLTPAIRPATTAEHNTQPVPTGTMTAQTQHEHPKQPVRVTARVVKEAASEEGKQIEVRVIAENADEHVSSPQRKQAVQRIRVERVQKSSSGNERPSPPARGRGSASGGGVSRGGDRAPARGPVYDGLPRRPEPQRAESRGPDARRGDGRGSAHSGPSRPDAPSSRMTPPSDRMGPGGPTQMRMGPPSPARVASPIALSQQARGIDALLQSDVVKALIELKANEAALKAQVETMRARMEMQEEIFDLRQAIERRELEAELREAHEHHEHFEREMDEVHEHHAHLERELDEANEHREHLERELAEAHEHHEHSEREMDEAHEHHAHLERELDEANEHREHLQRELAEAHEMREHAEMRIHRAEEMTERAQQMMREAELHQAERHKHADEAAVKLEHTVNRTRMLEGKLREMDQMNADLKEKLELVYRKYEADQVKAKEHVAKLNQELEQTAKARSEMEHRSRLLEAKLAEMVKTLADSKKQNTQSKNAEMKTLLDAARARAAAESEHGRRAAAEAMRRAEAVKRAERERQTELKKKAEMQAKAAAERKRAAAEQKALAEKRAAALKAEAEKRRELQKKNEEKKKRQNESKKEKSKGKKKDGDKEAA